MSPQPPETLFRGRAGGAIHALRHRLASWSTRAPLHTLFVHPQGVWGWAPDAAGVPIAYPDLESWCSAHVGSWARIVVSDQLVHNLVAEPGLPLHDAFALQVYARQQFVHYHGEVAQEWPIALWNAGSRGACALHGVDPAVLRRAAVMHDVRWAGMSPAWSDGLRAAAANLGDLAERERTGLACVEGTHLTCLLLERGHVTQLRQRFMDSSTCAGLADMLGALGDEMRFTSPPVVTGWGLEDAAEAAALPCTTLGRIDAIHPALEAFAPSLRQIGVRPWV